MEHKNPDIACLAVKIIREIAEDRDLEKEDSLVKILDNSNFKLSLNSEVIDI